MIKRPERKFITIFGLVIIIIILLIVNPNICTFGNISFKLDSKFFTQMFV